MHRNLNYIDSLLLSIKHQENVRKVYFCNQVVEAINLPSMLNNTRSSCLEVFCGKSVLRNFKKFRGKHLCQSLFFIILTIAFQHRVKNMEYHMVFYQNERISCRNLVYNKITILQTQNANGSPTGTSSFKITFIKSNLGHIITSL